MGWQDLADAVVSRRVELGFKTRQAFAEASGLSTKTLGEIERADRTSYDPATLAAVEQTLRWPSGHAKMLTSDEPSPLRVAKATTAATLRAAGYEVLENAEPDPIPREISYLLMLMHDLDAETRAIVLRQIDCISALIHAQYGRAEDLPDEPLALPQARKRMPAFTPKRPTS